MGYDISKDYPVLKAFFHFICCSEYGTSQKKAKRGKKRKERKKERTNEKGKKLLPTPTFRRV
jgi:hypothetical protein